MTVIPGSSSEFLNPVLMLVISTVITLIGVMIITVQMMSVWLAGQVLMFLPSYTMPRMSPIFTPAAATLPPI